MTSEFLELPNFPSSYHEQVVWFSQFVTSVQNRVNDVYSNVSISVIVSKADTAPSQSEWEAAWVARGLTLPIAPSAILVWWESTNSVVGGSFGTTPTSAGLVYSRDTRFPPGGTHVREVESKSDAVSSTVSIGALNTNHPNKTITLKRTSDLILTYALYVSLSSGTGEWGGDFLLDGVKVGTSLYGLPTNIGLSNAAASGPLYVEARVPNVAPGSHTIQAIMGVIKSPVSPPTIAYGGLTTWGLRTLTVRAVTL